MDGQAQRMGDEWELRFERRLPHPVAKVWDALTQPEQWKHWLAEGGQVDLRVGGRISMTGHGIESTITELDPPRLIAFGWNSFDWEGGIVRWELEPAEGGTQLVLTHRLKGMSQEQADEFRGRFDLPDGWKPVPSTLAGWHVLLDQLARALDGHTDQLEHQYWTKLNEEYAERLGSQVT
ncbi:MAG TPA: SRPBCC family protein [Actinomycetota bacterium]|nr:SRPBCC family protein [Actinomycetota bacterium]